MSSNGRVGMVSVIVRYCSSSLSQHDRVGVFA
jgi:hypothetical protein